MLKITEGRCAFIGMVHALPLPGSAGWAGNMAEVRRRAVADAEALLAGGCDALLVENMADVPYLRAQVDPETVAAMAVVVSDLAKLSVPLGVQVLAAANRQALGVAVAAGASFCRVEAFAYAHIADEGFLQASAAELVRARRALGADVAFLADVQKKHAAHALTADLGLADLAKGTVFCGADGLVVTGSETGASTAVEDVVAAREAGVPVYVGSGVTPADAGALAQVADGLIVGSYLKVGGDWRREVDVERVAAVRAVI